MYVSMDPAAMRAHFKSVSMGVWVSEECASH